MWVQWSVEGHGHLQGHRGTKRAGALKAGKWSRAELGVQEEGEGSKLQGLDWSWGAVTAPHGAEPCRAPFSGDPDVAQNMRCELVGSGLNNVPLPKKMSSSPESVNGKK